MENENPRGNVFRTNARIGAGIWEDFERNNGQSIMIRHRLTNSGREYLASRGLNFVQILSYKDFSKLIEEHGLNSEHYEVSLTPLKADTLSEKQRKYVLNFE